MAGKKEPLAIDRDKKSIKVTALPQGTVIDHLARGTALQVIQALGIEEAGTLLIGMNLESKKLGQKDLIKIENKELSQDEINKIALMSPGATFSIIRDFKVVEKVCPELPERVEGLVRCANPSCVTNKYDERSVFLVLRRDPVKVRCYYCERAFKKEEIVFR
jgi:aspartate carbamoyltransferase regulatory subunit